MTIAEIVVCLFSLGNAWLVVVVARKLSQVGSDEGFLPVLLFPVVLSFFGAFLSFGGAFGAAATFAIAAMLVNCVLTIPLWFTAKSRRKRMNQG